MKSLDELRDYIAMIVEASMATRRDFERSRQRFHSIPDFPGDFKDSRMVDSSGNPIVFYHGTRRDFANFSKEVLNSAGTQISTNYLGFYFTTSPDVAQIYISKQFDPKKGLASGGRVDSYLLNVKKPYYITENTYWKWGRGSPKEMEEIVIQLKTRGYDGIVMPSVWRGRGKGAYDVVVFEPNQIHKL